MLDEPSMGLDPIIVSSVFSIITEINKEGTTILLVEQNAHMVLSGWTKDQLIHHWVGIYGCMKKIKQKEKDLCFHSFCLFLGAYRTIDETFLS